MPTRGMKSKRTSSIPDVTALAKKATESKGATLLNEVIF